jgi:hypothetical protein
LCVIGLYLVVDPIFGRTNEMIAHVLLAREWVAVGNPMDPFNAYGIGRQDNCCSACPEWRPGQLPRIPYYAITAILDVGWD